VELLVVVVVVLVPVVTAVGDPPADAGAPFSVTSSPAASSPIGPAPGDEPADEAAFGCGGAGVAKISFCLSDLHSFSRSTYSEYRRCHSECGFSVSRTHCISSSFGTN